MPSRVPAALVPLSYVRRLLYLLMRRLSRRAFRSRENRRRGTHRAPLCFFRIVRRWFTREQLVLQVRGFSSREELRGTITEHGFQCGLLRIFVVSSC